MVFYKNEFNFISKKKKSLVLSKKFYKLFPKSYFQFIKKMIMNLLFKKKEVIREDLILVL